MWSGRGLWCTSRCCLATDREAVSEWWSRVGHPIFKAFIVEWETTDQANGVKRKHEEILLSPLTSVAQGTCAKNPRAFMDCALPQCKHDEAGSDVAWLGWQDYPGACCNMTCPATARKEYSSACNCMCQAGFLGEFCNETSTHVLAEMQLSGIGVRTFEKQGKQVTGIQKIALGVCVRACVHACVHVTDHT